MKSILKKIAGITAGTILALSLFGCANDGGDSHEHTFATDYSKDETYHWYAATCEHTEKVTGKEEHTFGEYVSNEDASYTADGTKTRVCSKCGYEDTVTDEGSKITEVTYKGKGMATAELEFDFSKHEFSFMADGEDWVKGTIPNDVTELAGEFELTVTHMIDYKTEDWTDNETIIEELFGPTSIPVSVNEDGSFNAEVGGIPTVFEETDDGKYVCAPEFDFIFDTEEKTITVKYNDEELEVMTYEGDIFTEGETITIYSKDSDSEGKPAIYEYEALVIETIITGNIAGYCSEITLVEAK